MDLLQGVKDMVEEADIRDIHEAPLGDIPMPSIGDVMKLLDGMTGMSEEDKEALKIQLLGQGTKGFGVQDVNPAGSQMLLLFALLFVIACIFVFFGYKLYKSLVEKERRREEKRKMKQMKKKK